MSYANGEIPDHLAHQRSFLWNSFLCFRFILQDPPILYNPARCIALSGCERAYTDLCLCFKQYLFVKNNEHVQSIKISTDRI